MVTRFKQYYNGHEKYLWSWSVSMPRQSVQTDKKKKN